MSSTVSAERLREQREWRENSIVREMENLAYVTNKKARRVMATLLHDGRRVNVRGPHTKHHNETYKPYPYITLWEQSFRELLGDYLKPHMSFVDVGCGAGDKLWLARNIQPLARITGIELSAIYAKHAKECCPFATIKNVNALNHDYKHYDVIYMYHPICDVPLQLKLEQRVAATMKRGALLLSATGNHLFNSNPQKYLKWVVFTEERPTRCWCRDCTPGGYNPSGIANKRKPDCTYNVYATIYRKP